MTAFADIYAASPDWLKFLWWLVFGIGPYITLLVALRMVLRFRLQRETLRQRTMQIVRPRMGGLIEGSRE